MEQSKTSQKEDIRPLLALYSQTSNEINYYRDMEWKIVAYTVAFLIGVAAITQSISVPPIHKPYIQTLLFIFIVYFTVYGIAHIHFLHKKLTWNRNIRTKIEKRLHFFDEGYIHYDILPSEWKVRSVPYGKLWHLISWWILISLTSVYTIYSIIFMKG